MEKSKTQISMTVVVTIAFVLVAFLSFLLGMIVGSKQGNLLNPPTPTPVPTATSTAIPTALPTIAPTHTPTQTPLPTATAIPATPTITNTPVPPPPDLMIIAMLNELRIQEGLWPFKVNDTLTEMAIAQAEYIISVDFNGDTHVDAAGRGPGQRAFERFGWPSYGTPALDRMAVGENARFDVDPVYAVGFWSESEIHRQAVLNPAYREIGVAAVPYGSGFYAFYAVFGARPGVLPALVDPEEEVIYLSSEEYQWSSSSDTIQDVTGYQFLEAIDADYDPEGWQEFVLTIPLPEGDGPFFLALTDGDQVVVIEVDPQKDIVLLPDNLSAYAQNE